MLSVVDKRQEEVYKAMGASLNEGWSLLLRLLERRQEVLTLAADFYHRALEVGSLLNMWNNVRKLLYLQFKLNL